jgi:hypothetical protein
MRYIITAISVLFMLTGCGESLQSDKKTDNSEDKEVTVESIGGGKADSVVDMPDVETSGDLPRPSFDYLEISLVARNCESNGCVSGVAVNIKKGFVKILKDGKDAKHMLSTEEKRALIENVFNTEFRQRFYEGFDCAKRVPDSPVYVRMVTKPMGQKYRRTGEELRYTSKNKDITSCVTGDPSTDDEMYLNGISRILMGVHKKFSSGK